MLFVSTSFLFIFLPSLLVLTWFLKRRYFNTVLLMGSLFFYWVGNGFFLIIILYIGILLYFQIKYDYFSNKTTILLILAPLLWFKYSSFAVDMLSKIFDLNMNTYSGELPLGISFFTFQSIAYYIDTKKQGKNHLKSLSEIVLFLTFFPQLVAGPIIKSIDFKSNLLKSDRFKKDEMQYGILRIGYGLIKKLLFANSLSRLVDVQSQAFETDVSMLSAWIIVLAFTFQIYFDFSGYCDIAVGLGKLLGFNLPENFNFPYQAKSFSEFWKRWHITLSQFFRDYVYIPLGGNKNGVLKTYRNLWITFLLTSLWHGANYNFILWGIVHGLFLSIEKIFSQSSLFSFLFRRRLTTFMLVSVSWVPFRFSEFEHIGIILKSLFSFSFVNDYTMALIVTEINFLTLIAFIAGILSVIINEKTIELFHKKLIISELVYSIYIYSVLLVGLTGVFISEYYPFIYFRF